MVLKIAHRGASGYESENSMSSFDKAVNLGCDMIELDVHLCRSLEVVVIHDFTLDRTTTGSGYISQKKLHQIKNVNLLHKNKETSQKVPTLREVLIRLDGKVMINIEIKKKYIAKYVCELIEEIISNYKYRADHFLISSFHISELKFISKNFSHLKIGILYTKVPKYIDELILNLNPYSIHIDYKNVTGKFIEKMKKINKKVFVWTVNFTSDINYMKFLNVDGIISNFPDRI